MFSLNAMIAWIKNAGHEADAVYDIGVKFVDVDEKVRSDLWHLISSSVHHVMDSKSH